MHLHRRNGRNRLERVVNGVAVMGISAGIDDDTVVPLKIGAVNGVDDGALAVALEQGQLVTAPLPLLPKIAANLLKAPAAVDPFFPDAQHIEIRAVDNHNFHRSKRSFQRRAPPTRALCSSQLPGPAAKQPSRLERGAP